jgi:signal transduction histidine kinase
LHYTGLAFSAPEKVRFRYQMEGLDADWVEAGTRRTAYYQRIPPGRYTFRVKACDADGIWAEEEASLPIIMSPYFYETNWFMAGATLTVLGSLAGMLRVVEQRRYRRRLIRLQTQHAIEKERLRISQDMHDNLGAILTQVSQLSDLCLSEATESSPARQRFDRIGTQARGAVQALDEIIWATNPKNDNLASFAEYVSRSADELVEGMETRWWQEVPASLPRVPIRADVRHNLFLAVREALNNALKHSGAKEIWLRIEYHEPEIILEVEDKGRGFDPEAAGSHGNGLSNMRSRMAEEGGRMELTSVPGQGTKVRFVLALEWRTESES